MEHLAFSFHLLTSSNFFIPLLLLSLLLLLVFALPLSLVHALPLLLCGCLTILLHHLLNYGTSKFFFIPLLLLSLLHFLVVTLPLCLNFALPLYLDLALPVLLGCLATTESPVVAGNNEERKIKQPSVTKTIGNKTEKRKKGSAHYWYSHAHAYIPIQKL